MANAFFDKLKQGVNETGKQAKIAVESNRLKMQINMKQKEIEGKYTEVGRLVYQSYKNGDLSNIQDQLETKYREIMDLEAEIEKTNRAILELKSTKECLCGELVDINARFCAKCGRSLEGGEMSDVSDQVNMRQCSCGNMMPSDARFCTACGQNFAEASDASNQVDTRQCSCGNTMPSDARFCTACGNKF